MMNIKCITGKKAFATAEIAEDVLIELWSKNDYREKNGPVAIYKCDDCGYYHFTSQGPMNEKLATFLSSDKLRLQKEANKWMDKFKDKYR